jgi:hypothetical protein
MSHAAEHFACHARADRYEPTVMVCIGCALAWDRDDPNPPKCRMVANAELAADEVEARN